MILHSDERKRIIAKKNKKSSKRKSPFPFQSFPAYTASPQRFYSCTSFIMRTSSPGLNAGRPIKGQVEHRNASPREQLLQEPVLPLTVKSSSFRSFESSLIASRFASACARRSFSSASNLAASPHVQSLQGRRRFWGWQSVAINISERTLVYEVRRGEGLGTSERTTGKKSKKGLGNVRA